MDETFERIAAELAYRPRTENNETRSFQRDYGRKGQLAAKGLRSGGRRIDLSITSDDREDQLARSGWSHAWREMMTALCPGTRVAAYFSLAAVAVLTFRWVGG